MKKMFKEFLKNLKEYIDYLMKVNFKELFVNTIILVCILILSSFVFVPIGIFQDVIRSFITIFVNFSLIFGLIYNWIFYLISFICFLLAFVYMFNKRFSDIEELKNSIDNKNVKKLKIEQNKNNKEKEEFELPKKKESK